MSSWCTQSRKECTLSPTFTLLYSLNVFAVLNAFICTIPAPSTTVTTASGCSYLTVTSSPDGPFSWYRHFRKFDLAVGFRIFLNQPGQVDICGSRAKGVNTNQLAMIFIQYKNLSIAEHAFSMLKLASFFL